VLTGVAAVVTATGGLIGVVYSLPHRDAGGSMPSSSNGSIPKTTQEAKTADPPSTRPDTAVASRTPAEEAPGHVSTPSAYPIRVGDNVIARWSDDCLYSGTVLKAQNEKYLVQYDFSQENWVNRESIFELVPLAATALRPGTEVYAKLDNRQSKWLPSTVSRSENGKYLLVLEKGKCLSGPVDVWANEDQIALAQ
jgi:hypothetical protein